MPIEDLAAVNWQQVAVTPAACKLAKKDDRTVTLYWTKNGWQKSQNEKTESEVA
jgi:hypothetical protein